MASGDSAMPHFCCPHCGEWFIVTVPLADDEPETSPSLPCVAKSPTGFSRSPCCARDILRFIRGRISIAGIVSWVTMGAVLACGVVGIAIVLSVFRLHPCTEADAHSAVRVWLDANVPGQAYAVTDWGQPWWDESQPGDFKIHVRWREHDSDGETKEVAGTFQVMGDKEKSFWYMTNER